MISINEFVRRHAENSPLSHYSGSWTSLVAMVEDNFDKAKPGYRDGVKVVPVPPQGFFAPIVRLTEGDIVNGTFSPRKEGEDPRIHTITVPFGTKVPAEFVDIVIYSHDVLAEKGEFSTDAEWEIISINASLTSGDPQHFLSMFCNHFNLSGGTDTKMSNDEFVAKLKESYLFWCDKALAGR